MAAHPFASATDFELLPGVPAGAFSSPNAEAFRAIDAERPADAVVALICEPGLPHREELIEPLAALRGDTLMRLIGWGVVDWPPRGRRCFALVFAQPGERIVASLAETIAPFSEEDVLNLVLPPVMAGLKALHAIGHTHRALRPTNLFRSAADQRLVLGECLSAPPALAQPIACEPIESAFADPIGRGAGAPADDLFALGATLVFLLLGRDPSQGMTKDQLLAARMSRGSFAALLGGGRPPLRMLEPIRGLLADDPRERWTLPDLESWAQRGRLVTRQAAPPKRAGRPLELGGAGHVTARSLAQGFARDPAAAAKLVKSGEFDVWLQRSLADPERSAAVAAALAETPDPDSMAGEARLVARLATALDPKAPLRYGSLAAAIDGFGPALADGFRTGAGATIVADAIMARLPQFWLAVQGFKPEQVPQFRMFDRLRQLLEDRRAGYGLERVLYELNPGLHCLSPSIEREHVLDPGALFGALERAAAAGSIGEMLIDRHVAGFIAARCKAAGTDWQEELASADAQHRALGTLLLLARLQCLRGPQAVPALGERIGHELPALIERYRSRSRRARVRAALAKLGNKGNLAEIAGLVADRARAIAATRRSSAQRARNARRSSTRSR